MANIAPRAGARDTTRPPLLASYADRPDAWLGYHERSGAVGAEEGVAFVAVRPDILAEEAEGTVE